MESGSRAPIHPALVPLSFLLGTWRGEGEGGFPTISSFRYGEEITFSHSGKPVIAYSQKTWKLASGEPMHAESGYWRPKNDGSIEVVIAQSTGLVEVQKGTYDAGNKMVKLQSELVGNASKVKLTILIEDPREAERKRLLGIEASNDVTRDDLVAALEDVNEGRIPENRVALRMLAEEMINWPNLEVEAPKTKPSKSLYAKATDTGVDLKAAAKRLNIDWDSAAEIEDDDENAEEVVPPAVGYGALYLVTLLPVIIGISVVLILFYNSLQ